MIDDPNDFPVSLKVPPLSLSETHVIMSWAHVNGFAVRFAFGNIYFMKDEHATLFRLRFGL